MTIESHEIIITQPVIVVIVAGINLVFPGGRQGHLRLCGLRLLGALVGRTLLAHLLVTSSRQGTGDLLDLTRGQILDQLLGEILCPQSIVRLLRVRRQHRPNGRGNLSKLLLRRRLEQWHRRKINRISRIRRIRNHNRLGRRTPVLHPLHIHVPNINRTPTSTTTTTTTEQILRVRKIRVLLRTAQALPARGLVLVALGVGLFLLGLFPPNLFMLFYPLVLGFLVCGGFGFGFGFSFGGFGFFFALDVAVFGRVPGVEDLFVLVVSLLLEYGWCF